MTNARDRAVELVEEGLISWETLATAAIKFMSTDDVEKMLDVNQLSDRYLEENEDELEEGDDPDPMDDFNHV